MARNTPPDAGHLLLVAALPFPLAIIVTFAFALTIGESISRQILPGSSLALPGFLLALLLWAAILIVIRRRWADARARLFGAIVCAAASLMAWPVWVTGPLPSINGMALSAPTTTPMRLADLGTGTLSRTRSVYHWARLEPIGPEGRIGAGKYITTDGVNRRWAGARGSMVRVVHARGWLGAETGLGYR